MGGLKEPHSHSCNISSIYLSYFLCGCDGAGVPPGPGPTRRSVSARKESRNTPGTHKTGPRARTGPSLWRAAATSVGVNLEPQPHRWVE